MRSAPDWKLRFVTAVSAAAGILLAAPAATGGHWRDPLHVAVAGDGGVYLDGARVDTLRVHRGQIVRWEKLDPSGPDLTVQFERKLFHARHRVRVTIAGDGKPRFVRVNPRARKRVYFGKPEDGFAGGAGARDSLWIRVVPPPESR